MIRILEDETSDIQTSEPVGFYYQHNLSKAPKMGRLFAQDIEPTGKYINFWKPIWGTIPNAEYGRIIFENPIVLEWKTSSHGGWKTDLSELYGGKKRKALSKALQRDGFDGVITVDSNKDIIREIVIL